MMVEARYAPYCDQLQAVFQSKSQVEQITTRLNQRFHVFSPPIISKQSLQTQSIRTIADDEAITRHDNDPKDEAHHDVKGE